MSADRAPAAERELVERFVDTLIEDAMHQVDARYLALFNATYELFHPESSPPEGRGAGSETRRPLINFTPRLTSRRLSSIGFRVIDGLTAPSGSEPDSTEVLNERDIDRITTRFIPESEAVSCAICLDDIKNEHGKELPCKHLFHTHCVDNWLMNEKVTCPMCRVVVAPP